jgi:hypothetical protein
VLVTGHAHEVTEEQTLRRVRAALDAKYDRFRSERSRMPEATRSVYEAPGTVTFEIVPDDRVLTWDNARIELS